MSKKPERRIISEKQRRALIRRSRIEYRNELRKAHRIFRVAVTKFLQDIKDIEEPTP